MKEEIIVLAFYHIVPIENPKQEMKEQKRFCAQHNLQGRVYIADHGINGQMSGDREGAKAYMEWMHQRELFHDVHFKLHNWHEHCFPRMQIKVKPKVVACDHPVNWQHRGKHLSPKEWKAFLDQENPPPVLDARNDYEWEIGRFKGAKKPPCGTFRDFDRWASDLKQEHDPKKPILMYCTGGIRCELFSSMLQERGFEEVYQLQGGVINYGLEEGAKHWDGKLFVFDDRMAVPISEEETAVIGRCSLCQTPCDTYYNCANMDCNELFIACPDCLQTHQGCCQASCATQERVRPLDEQQPSKPFKKWYNYLLTK